MRVLSSSTRTTTPFPVLPIMVLVVSLLSTWIVEMSLSSYVGYMVEHLGIVEDKDQAGYYAGILLSALMTGRIVSAYFWGVFADRYGRRPVIFISLGSTLVFSTAFGVSSTFCWAFFFRFLLGLLNGMVPLWPTLVSEVCGKEHEVVGMGLMTMVWSLGALLGSGLGGVLAQPATHYPFLFSESGLFGRFPYLLPNLFGGGMSLVSLPLVVCFFGETLPKVRTDTDETTRLTPSKDGSAEYLSTVVDSAGDSNTRGSDTATNTGVRPFQQQWGDSPHVAVDEESSGSYSSPSCSASDDEDEETAAGGRGPTLSSATAPVNNSSWTEWGNMPRALSLNMPRALSLNMPHSLSVAVENEVFGGSTKRKGLLTEPRIRFLLFTYGVYSLVVSGLENVYSLWAMSTVPKGGLDWSTEEIGQVLLTVGVMVFAFELFALPVLLTRLGISWCQRAGAAILFPAYLLLPQLSSLQGTGYTLIVASLTVMFMIYIACDLFQTGISLAINNACSVDRRGQLNGIASSVASVASAVGPAVWSAMFAFSIEGGRHAFPFDFHLTFYIMAALRLAVAYFAWDANVEEGDVACSHFGGIMEEEKTPKTTNISL